jgi:hypothetical protein
MQQFSQECIIRPFIGRIIIREGSSHVFNTLKCELFHNQGMLCSSNSQTIEARVPNF